MKELGIPVEFVPEYARQYIAKKRLEKGLRPGQALKLLDKDQKIILKKQADLEWTMAKVCGPNVTVISDASPLNTLLYMSPSLRDSLEVKRIIKNKVLPVADLVFYATPLFEEVCLDPNRIHSIQQSKEIDASIPKIINMKMLVPLYGSAAVRVSQVMAALNGKPRR